jgi:hypothetical protein
MYRIGVIDKMSINNVNTNAKAKARLHWCSRRAIGALVLAAFGAGVAVSLKMASFTACCASAGIARFLVAGL